MTLQDFRIQHALTQEEIAKRIDIPYETYRRYEYGKGFPKKKALVELARLYNMTPGELLNSLIGVNNNSLKAFKEDKIMPIIPMINLPRPESPKEFEYLLRDYCQETYGGLAQLYGRQGQRQNGVDIIVTRPDGTRACVQCKNYRDTKIAVSDIDQWIAEFDSTKYDMSVFVIATSLPKPDAKLQEHVYQISDKRVKEGLSPINIIFWNDIEHFVLKHPDIFESYWPQFATGLREKKAVLYLPPNSSTFGITSGHELRNQFLDVYAKYKIAEYLRQDPFIGFAFDHLLNVDCFMDAVRELLDRAISITNTDSYQHIIDFGDAFNDYNDYQSTICGMRANGNIGFLPPYGEYNLNEYKNTIDKLKIRVIERQDVIKNDD